MSSYKPILSEENSPGWNLFQSVPSPEPGVALVLYREGHSLTTLLPGSRLTAGEIRWGKYRKIYRVDVSTHTFSFNTTLPCQSDAFNFNASAQVTCSVNDPALIVTHRVTDAEAVLTDLIIKTMRDISRQFDVERSKDAEQAIDRVLESQTYDIGIVLHRVIVRLTLEEDARTYIRRLRQYDRDAVLVEREAQLQQQKDELEQKYLKSKMSFYGPLIEQGQWQLLALQLANNPNDVPAIIQMIDSQRQLEMKQQLEVLKFMLEEDVLDGFQLESVGKRALQKLVDGLGVNFLPLSDGTAGNNNEDASS
ncbi:MAG: hypothetical protein H6650_10450 [Ardenticatenales bacterium]|nr:hypothetical protein [Ardenticatenales bacterium]